MLPLNSKNENVMQAGPTEIAIEILKWLDCRALLSVRQTCKFLDDVSRMRPIWMNLVAAQGTFLEGPLDSYTTEQLQFHVCKQIGATLEWQSDHPEPSQVKKVDIPPNHSMVLIRGGRWLLVCFATGAVVAYDLDSAHSRKFTIVEPGHLGGPISKLLVDMDNSAKYLRFKLGVLCNRPQAPMLEIYQVSLVGRGDKAELAATRIIVIGPSVRCHISFVTLRGGYFCRGSSIFFPSHDRIEVVKWGGCRKLGSHPVGIIFLGNQNRLISGEILPENQILLLIQGYIVIYDIPEPQLADSQVLYTDVTQPRWRLSIEGRWDVNTHYVQMSTPHLNHLSSHTAYTTVDGIYGVIVPLDPSERPEVVKLLDFTVANRSTFVIGVEKIFILCKSEGLFAGNYSFEKPRPRTGFNPAARRRGSRWPVTRTSIAMDEQTGRVVIGLEGENYVKVLDFSRNIETDESVGIGKSGIYSHMIELLLRLTYWAHS